MVVPRELRHIVKMPLFERASAPVIERMWEQHFRSKSGVFADVMSCEEFECFQRNASHAPFFIAPLALHSGLQLHGATPAGYKNLLVQVQQAKTILFTPLDDFHRLKETAPAAAIANVFGDLVDSKGIALVRIDAVRDVTAVAPQLAHLLHYVKTFYLNPTAFEWVRRFNHHSRDFVFASLVQEYPHFFPTLT